MGWISKPVKHKCSKPYINHDMVDWVWECDVCFAHWIVAARDYSGYTYFKLEREGNKIVIETLDNKPLLKGDPRVEVHSGLCLCGVCILKT